MLKLKQIILFSLKIDPCEQKAILKEWSFEGRGFPHEWNRQQLLGRMNHNVCCQRGLRRAAFVFQHYFESNGLLMKFNDETVKFKGIMTTTDDDSKRCLTTRSSSFYMDAICQGRPSLKKKQKKNWLSTTVSQPVIPNNHFTKWYTMFYGMYDLSIYYYIIALSIKVWSFK